MIWKIKVGLQHARPMVGLPTNIAYRIGIVQCMSKPTTHGNDDACLYPTYHGKNDTER